jgi:hypothetical protein
MILPQQENILKVTEYRRLQNGSRAREWQVPAAQDLPKACADLNAQFKTVHNSIPSLPTQDVWRALAVYQDQELSLSTGKSALSSVLIEQSKHVKATPFRLTWDGIHLLAQYHGSYYSFRILKQILETVVLYNDAKDLPLALRELHMELISLPALEDLPPIVEAVRNIGSPEDQAILEMSQKLLDIEVVDEPIKVLAKRSRKKRKTAAMAEDPIAPEESKQREKSNNLEEQKRQERSRHVKGSKRQEESKRRQNRPNNVFELLYNE